MDRLTVKLSLDRRAGPQSRLRPPHAGPRGAVGNKPQRAKAHPQARAWAHGPPQKRRVTASEADIEVSAIARPRLSVEAALTNSEVAPLAR